MQARITEKHMISDDLCIIHMIPEKKLIYKPGQYLYLTVNGYDPRPYSIASCPSDSNVIELHIRRGGKVTNHIYDNVSIDDSVEISDIQGVCTYKAQCKKPILAIAGGTGLAQIKPLVEKALSTNRENPVYLYHGVKTQHDLYLDHHFKKLSKEDPRLLYRPQIKEDMRDNDPKKYAFLVENIEQDFNDLKNFRAYLSGNPEMITALKAIMLAKGIDGNRLHYDGY